MSKEYPAGKNCNASVSAADGRGRRPLFLNKYVCMCVCACARAGAGSVLFGSECSRRMFYVPKFVASTYLKLHPTLTTSDAPTDAHNKIVCGASPQAVVLAHDIDELARVSMRLCTMVGS